MDTKEEEKENNNNSNNSSSSSNLPQRTVLPRSVRVRPPNKCLNYATQLYYLRMIEVLDVPWRLSFAVQAVGWLLASTFKTSTFYDLFGSVTFLAVICSLPNTHHASSAMAIVWCSRLGTFLTYRAMKHGEDSRFDAMLQAPLKFAVAWFLQGVWVVISLLPVILRAHRAAGSPAAAEAPGLYYAGAALFASGFALEVVADAQKWAFKCQEGNAKRRMETGVWKHIKYPNYAGEILLWVGIALTAAADCPGPAELALSALSPAFVAFLLVFVSGIPPQEAKKREYGDGRRDNRAKLVPHVF
jgi:steroid 5-alpha reductase family enzyme